MNNDTNTDTTTAAPAQRKVLIHARNEEDKKLLQDSFDLTRLGANPRFVTGLMTDAQMSMVQAAAQGKRIVSSGLPLDIAANLGEVTIVRAWSRVKDDGSKSAGSTPPADYYARKIVDAEAFARLKESADFLAAFALGEEEAEAF